MSDLLLKAHTTAEAGVQKLAERYADRSDRGQTAVEYLGIIAVVAAIVLAIAGTDIGQQIFDAITAKVGEVTG